MLQIILSSISAIGGFYLLRELRGTLDLRAQYEATTGQPSSVTEGDVLIAKGSCYALIGLGIFGIYHSLKRKA
jgi:hypothetical protein